MNYFDEQEREEAIAIALSAIQQRFGLYENNEDMRKALDRVLEYKDSQDNTSDTVTAYALIIVIQWGLMLILVIALILALTF